MSASAGEQLAEDLREVRRRSGLSLAALAARTPYSKSSWERYLNGRKPAPRQAVEALCALTGEPGGRMLALWELADAEWSGRARAGAASGPAAVRAGPAASHAPVAPVADTPEGAARGRRWPRGPSRAGVRRWSVAVAVAVVAAGGLSASSLVGAGAGGRAGAVTESPVRNPGCRGSTCEGRSPTEMGCGGSGMITTLATRTTSDGRRLELRHAELCHAVWVRATGLEAGERVRLTLPAGRTQQVVAEGHSVDGRYLSTPMSAGDGGGGVAFCLERPGGDSECFEG
ncbi:helix-turn-helix domain-containing protein [Streptomyces sp. NPDC055632]